MAYRFEFNRFTDIAVPVLEDSRIAFDYEMSVSTESSHMASCCCEACDPDLDSEDIDYTNYGLEGYTSGWLDFGALGADHNHEHDGKEVDGGPLSAGAADTIAGDATTTATLAIDGIAYGVRNSSTDQDWFQVDLVAGQEYTFFMIRTDVNGVKAHADPELFLFAPNGTTQVATNDDTPSGGQNSRITYTATETGTFFLAADGWQTSTGGYMVTASEDNDRVDFTNTQIADFLTDGFSPRSYWDQAVITYNMDGIPDGTNGTDSIQALIIKALDAWAEVTGLVFQQVTGVTGDISFIDTQQGAYSSSSTTGNANGDRTITSSTINVSQAQWVGNYGDDVNSYTYQTYIHEIGHTLGLGHGGPYNGSSTYGIDNAFTQDTWNHTVMSYHSQGEANSGSSRLVLGLQVADILAIQDLYGANGAGTRSGDTVYGANATEAGSIYDFDAWDAAGVRPPSFAIYDTGGVDTFDVSIYSTNQIINLVASGDTISESSVGNNGGVALANVISIAVGTVIENAIGGSGNDTIIGNDVSNELEGNGGNDIIEGGDGTDYAIYNGAQASYTITDNGDGTWTIIGEGTDTLSNVEFARFTDGDVALAPGSGTDLTQNNDNYSGTSGDDIINGLAGDDTIFGLAGNDVINGGEGRDIMFGGAGDDTLNGDAGNDDFYGGSGADVMNGGEGADRVFYSTAAAGITANFIDQSLNTGEAAGDTYNSIESITGSNFDDVITSGGDNNDLVGLGGNDVLNGAGGRDRLFGGTGDDRLLGGLGNDDLHGQGGADTYVIQSGAGADRIFTYEAGIDLIQYIGGPGDMSDLTIEQVGANTRITSIVGVLTLMGIDATTITAADFSFVNPLPDATGVTVTTDLTSGNDTFTGDENDDVVNGLAGNDTIRGGIGDDTLNGGDGNDLLTGGLGADVLNGGDGIDRVLYSTASTGVTINVLNPSLNTGEAAGDSYISIENFSGSNGNDNITSGNEGNQLIGLGGNDTLIGAGGDDTLFGGDDDDRLVGGADNDTLFGQGGADTFVFFAGSGNDTIRDFEDGVDIIEFRDTVDAFTDLTLTQSGNNAIITSANGTITLIDIDIADLTVDDFAFI